MEARAQRPVSRRDLEASLESYFRKTVRLLGGRAVKLAPTEKGVPDRLALMPGGIMLLVELKTDSGALSAAQRVWHERAAEMGTPVAVVVGRDGVDQWAAAVKRAYLRLPRHGRLKPLDREAQDRIYKTDIRKTN